MVGFMDNEFTFLVQVSKCISALLSLPGNMFTLRVKKYSQTLSRH